MSTIEQRLRDYVNNTDDCALRTEAAKELESRQAKIDALMLEFCPGEMSVPQLSNWSHHQRPAYIPQEGEISMNDAERKALALNTLMLLSALESWAYSLGKVLPRFIEDDLARVTTALKGQVLDAVQPPVVGND